MFMYMYVYINTRIYKHSYTFQSGRSYCTYFEDILIYHPTKLEDISRWYDAHYFKNNPVSK